MVRTRTSAGGDQEPIHAPTSGSTIRGRGRERGRGRGQGPGRGRIVAPVEGQVPIATQGHNRTVPLNAGVIHGDVQDHVEGDVPAHAPPSIKSTLVLQDTLARILGLLEGMAQAGTLPVTSDALQTHI
ncbi:hypothetical protein KY289_026884 [Solanum tuberosum]|nr:hypothetical protein KY289_026884 [Solanum tuberosum]